MMSLAQNVKQKKKSRDSLRSVEERLCQEILQTNRTTGSLPR